MATVKPDDWLPAWDALRCTEPLCCRLEDHDGDHVYYEDEIEIVRDESQPAWEIEAFTSGKIIRREYFNGEVIREETYQPGDDIPWLH